MRLYLLLLLLLCTVSASAQSRSQLDSIKVILEEVFRNDQQPRLHMDSLQKKYGTNSTEVSDHWKHINTTDSLNKKTVTTIIDRYGWLGAAETSDNANAALFLTIQHADIATQIKYLPLLKKAISQGKAQPSSYAYLYDRIQMNTGYYQTYGTQVSGDSKGNLCFWPIQDERNVNSRRKALGLNPIQDYAKDFNITYRPPIKDLLKGNVIINGYVTDGGQHPLASVNVYISQNKLIARTDSDGCFRIIIPRSALRSPLVFRKTGFVTSPFLEKDKGDVFYIDVSLKKVGNVKPANLLFHS